MTNTITIVDGLFGGERGATFCGDDCHGENPDCHRFKLWRDWDITTQYVLFVMLNPSTADENKLDPTVNRCKGYAEDWNFGGVYVGNLYGIRETDSDKMLTYDDPIGPGNMEALKEMASHPRCGMVVVAWGTKGVHVPGHQEAVLELLREHGPGKVHALKVVGKGKNRNPGHPLYLPKKLQPVVYDG